MNDVEMIADLLAKPAPSDAVVAQGRARLAARTRPRRSRLFLGSFLGATLAGAAAAVMITVVTTGAAKVADPQAEPSFFLVAAQAAEKQPASTGRYWHTAFDVVWTSYQGKPPRRQARKNDLEEWVDATGRTWTRILDGELVMRTSKKPLAFCDKEVPLGFFATLPAEPAALRAAATRAMRNNDDGPVPADMQDQFVTGCLMTLLERSPAAPDVRAAAYRSLADLADAESLGTKTDSRGRTGEGLRLKFRDSTLVAIIDPATAQVLEIEEVHGDRPQTPYNETSSLRRTLRVNEWTDARPA